MKIDDLARSIQSGPQADAMKRLAQAKPAGAPAAEDAKLKEVAMQFEQFFVQQLLKQARETNEAMRDEPTGSEQQTYEEWQDDAMAQGVASGQGIGLGEMIYKQLIESQLRQTPAPAATAAEITPPVRK